MWTSAAVAVAFGVKQSSGTIPDTLHPGREFGTEKFPPARLLNECVQNISNHKAEELAYALLAPITLLAHPLLASITLLAYPLLA